MLQGSTIMRQLTKVIIGNVFLLRIMQRTLLVNSSCRDILTILNIVYHSKGEISHT